MSPIAGQFVTRTFEYNGGRADDEQRYRAVKPPSTGSAAPVMKDAASVQSHTTSPATSSGDPSRSPEPPCLPIVPT